MPASPSDKRPNPDALLARVQRSEAREKHGQLKIYLGMCAGVGKTYAMLSDALIIKDRGVDIVAGYIEPHGRPDTDALAKKFEPIPSRQIDHNGVTILEFDLDAALKRKPAIVLVDELAHTNAPGSRHTKRWQDVNELLDAGIDVFSTVNIQHLESLNDVVARITGTTVQETVPDSFFVRAGKIEVIDIPPEELIQRLKEGKVYTPEKVETALANFFREGNLMALRELVLRQVADRVDAEMRQYRQEKSVDEIWPTAQRIVVCVAPNTLSSRVVRAAARLASTLKGELIAISVENSRYGMLTDAQRRQAVKALAAAEDLGAEVLIREGEDIVGTILQVARERNATAIVTGKPFRTRWREVLFGSVVDELIRRGGDISVHVIPGGKAEGTPVKHVPRQAGMSLRGIFLAVGVTAAATALCALVFPYLALSNLIMIYLLGVTWISTKQGQAEAALAALLSVCAFDFFFVAPQFTFAVQDAQYVLTFFVMLVIALLISKLAQQLKGQSAVSSERERRTAALYALSRQLSRSTTQEELAAVTLSQLRSSFRCEGALLIADASGTLEVIASSPGRTESEANERAVAQWVCERAKPAGAGTDTLGGAKGRYVPLVFDERTFGVLALFLAEPLLSITERDLLEAFTSQIAHTLHRVRLETESRAAQVLVEGEQLRSTLLSSVSHDLRTPLASIAGAASTLIEHGKLDELTRTELATTIYNESERLGRILRNVLDVTRLESGPVKLRLEWNSLEEIVGSAVRRTKQLLAERNLKIEIPTELPIVYIDGMLFEQVFVNLLENAAKHTSATCSVSIRAFIRADNLICEVFDDGPGLPPGEQENVFEKLHQSPGREGHGIGLGLAICRAVIAAHGGTIIAENRTSGGALFRVALPLSKVVPEKPCVESQ